MRQNAHKTLFQSTVDIHFQNAHKIHTNLRRLALCAFILHLGIQFLFSDVVVSLTEQTGMKYRSKKEVPARPPVQTSTFKIISI